MRTIWRRPKPIDQSKIFRVNERIKAPAVFLIDENGEKVGVVATIKALAMAREAELDLIEVNPKANPPVAKIMDYGKFKYEREKKEHKQKVQQKKVDVKGIRLSIRISKHDFDFRFEQAKRFLARSDKLRIELILKGREKQHPQRAVEIINNFISGLKRIEGFNIISEQDLTKQGGRFTIVLVNKK